MARFYTDDQRLEMMVRDRRALHRIPEYGYDLFKTREYVLARLNEIGPDEIIPMGEGFKVVFRAKNPAKPAIAFRADMDALKIGEENTHDFVS